MNTITELLTDLACEIDDLSIAHGYHDRDEVDIHIAALRATQEALVALVFARPTDLVAAFQQASDNETAEDIDQLLGTVEARADHPTARGSKAALYIDNGMVVRCPNGQTGTVGSSHYSGDIEGNGTATLCFIDGTQWQGPARTLITMLAVTLDEM